MIATRCLAAAKPAASYLRTTADVQHQPDRQRQSRPLQTGNPAKNSKDALIGATGLYEQCALITSDRVLRREATALGIEVLHGHELLTELGYTGP
jgi:rRNA-processing protein FCF1